MSDYLNKLIDKELGECNRIKVYRPTRHEDSMKLLPVEMEDSPRFVLIKVGRNHDTDIKRTKSFLHVIKDWFRCLNGKPTLKTRRVKS